MTNNPTIDGVSRELTVTVKITAQQEEDILRFFDTCEDNQGYDVPKPRMKSLAKLGLIRSTGFSRYEITHAGDSVIEKLCEPADAPAVERQEPDENSEWEDTFGPDYEDDSEPLEIVAVISTEQKERGHYFTPDQLQRFNRLYLKTPALSYTIELVRLKDANRLQIEIATLQSTIACLEARVAELESKAK